MIHEPPSSTELLRKHHGEPRKQSGDEVVFDCLFCSDSSGHLYVNLSTGLYHCKKCDTRGNGWTLAKHLGEPVSSHSTPVRSILDVAVAFYVGCITDDAHAYLRSRKLSDETIETYRLGLAKGGLGEHLEAKGFSREERVASGLVDEKGRDFLYRRIVFPYIESGHVTTLRGRTMPGTQGKKVLGLPGVETRLYCADQLRSPGKIVVAEGEIDALTLIQAGLSAVGVPGVGILKDAWAAALARHEQVTVAFDGDVPGLEGARRVAERLGVVTRIASLPPDQDVNDLACAGRDIADLITQARPFVDIRIDEIEPLDATERVGPLRELIRQVAKLDRLAREHYRGVISDRLDIRKGVIDEEFEEAEKPTLALVTREDDIPPRMSDAQRADALALLSDPDLDTRVLDALDALGCAGEETNKLMVFLAFTSRKLPDPIATSIKGESSSGKSYLVEAVAGLFPPEDLRIVSALSPKALYHLPESLAHKVLIVFERDGADDSDYAIRNMLSEKRLIFSVVEKNEAGQMMTVDKTIEGPMAYAETTTRPLLHPENETRSFDLHMDESREQTERIVDAANRVHLAGGRDIAVQDVFRDAQRLLEVLPVHIPYISLIEFPVEPVRVRRDRGRFLALIQARALLFQRQRERITIGGNEHVLADITDYALAFRLAEDVLANTVRQTSPKLITMWQAAADLTGRDTETEFNRAQLQDTLGWAKNTVDKHARAAVAAGFFKLESSEAGKAHTYRLGRDPEGAAVKLLSPEELQEKMSRTQPTHTHPKGGLGR